MSRFLDEKSKKLLIVFGIFIGFIILIFIIATIIGKAKTTSMSYGEIEDVLVSASQKYYNKNNSLLPVNDNETIEIYDQTLIQDGYMKEISKYQKNKNVSCSGKVIVTKSGKYYDYSPYLECGDTYTTKYLNDKLLDNLTNSGDGLYSMNQYYNNKASKVYVYRGEYPNNYIILDGRLWKILRVNADKSISLILYKFDNKRMESTVWDNRYNIYTNTYDGINVYEKSRIRDSVEFLYSEDFIGEAFISKLVSRKLCIGTRSLSDKKKDGSIECSKMSSFSEFVSLPIASDFLNASIDTNCLSLNDNSCSNYNYLVTYSKSWWLLTTSKDDVISGYAISGNVSEKKLSRTAYLRPVITLNDHTIYVSGDGTYDNPYIVK